MIISLSARMKMKQDAGSVVEVRTLNCTYQVSIGREEVNVFAPGLERTFLIGEDEDIHDLLSDEGKAVLAVMLLEET